MLTFIRGFIDDEAGAAAVEYVLIYAVIGGSFAAGALYLGRKIADAMSAKGDAIEACANGTSTATC
jgi:Flp pilus assembly pilin Flp